MNNIKNSSSKLAEFVSGMKAALPFHLGVFPFGLVFGVLGIESGLSMIQTILMSSIIFGGASQIVFVQLWSAGVPPIVIGSSVGMVNIRHILYGASISKYIEHLPLHWRIILAYLMSDQAYSVSIKRYRSGKFLKFSHYYFLGAGFIMWIGWQAATVVGVLSAEVIPEKWSLTFAIALTFIAIVIPLVKSKSEIISFITAGVLSIVLQPLPWKLWLITAALGGIFAGWSTAIMFNEKRKSNI